LKEVNRKEDIPGVQKGEMRRVEVLSLLLSFHYFEVRSVYFPSYVCLLLQVKCVDFKYFSEIASWERGETCTGFCWESPKEKTT
jgi:hypothetical protein